MPKFAPPYHQKLLATSFELLQCVSNVAKGGRSDNTYHTVTLAPHHLFFYLITYLLLTPVVIDVLKTGF